MIQFNLLPDIKIHYLKAKRQKHTVVLVSIIASAVSLAVFIMLLTTVFVLQKKNMSDLNKDIKATSQELQDVDDLNKILTVQNQLGALTTLHDEKVVSSRLLGYLTQVTPANTSIAKLSVDYDLNSMVITGNTEGLNVVNTYTDTLKFTKYAVKGQQGKEKAAFSEVVLTNFTRDPKSTTFEISLKFDPVIFSNASEVTLNVPKIITTRSETDKPSDVFQSPEAQ